MSIWGGNWRMPTTDELRKLYDLCNNEWTTNYNETGAKGRIFKLKTDDSKQLFFPAAGSCYLGSVDSVGSFGGSWSSSLHSTNSGHDLSFSNSGAVPQSLIYRCCGFSVRGFMPKSE